MTVNTWVLELYVNLTQNGLETLFPQLFLTQLHCSLQEAILPEFKATMLPIEGEIPEEQLIKYVENFACACNNIVEYLRSLLSACEGRLDEATVISARDMVVHSIFHSEIRKELNPILVHYMKMLLEVCESGLDEISFPDGQSSAVEKMSYVLKDQTLNFDFLFRDIYTDFMEQHLSEKITSQCADNFDQELIDELITYKTQIIERLWLHILFPHSLTISTMVQKDLIYRLYYKCRREELFSIVVDYPDSKPAILDLRKCLEKTQLRPDLIKTLKANVTRRLLHPGVNTKEVLAGYICVVRALRLLDPSYVAQELVCKPIAAYLRQREDAIRSIIDKVIAEDGSADLRSELSLPKPVDIEEDSDDEAADEEYPEKWVDWKPDPVDAMYHRGLGRRHTDLLSMMVGMYGSREMFVNEYRTLLAQRLLKKICFDTDREIRNLEMLKLRFGDQNLHECEVMLKDIHDSKRINSLVKETIPILEEREPPTCEELKEFPVSAYILSGAFWPPFKEESLKVPATLYEPFDKFTRAFEKLKGNRSLSWLPSIGSVNMDVELAGHRITLDVTPTQAVLLEFFSTRTNWGLKELAKEMETPLSTLRRSIGVWVQHGVLVETSPDQFCVSDKPLRGQSEAGMPTAYLEADVESGVSSSKGQRGEELQLFWTYIVGMLTNLGSLTLDRIQSMLKMFAMSGSGISECTKDQIKDFLDKKVRDGVLLYTDDSYKLVKT